MKKRSSRKITATAIVLTMTMLISCSCSINSKSNGDYEELDAEYNELKEERDGIKSDLKNANASLDQVEGELQQAQSDLEQAKAELENAKTSLAQAESEREEVSAQYESYKESMSEFEGLSADEKKAREIEASKVIESEAEESRKASEKAAKESEEKEKKGYDTGITYDQLARTPDDYEGEKVKFKGKVIQVVDGDGEVTLRVAVNSNYDKVILVVYSKSIVSSRVLEDDTITVYGTSQGLYTYQSTMGGMITIPLIFADKIDQ